MLMQMLEEIERAGKVLRSWHAGKSCLARREIR